MKVWLYTKRLSILKSCIRFSVNGLSWEDTSTTHKSSNDVPANSSERWKGAECAPRGNLFWNLFSSPRCKLPRPVKILTLQSTLAHANTDIAPFVCLFSFVLIFPLSPSWCFCQHILLSEERDGGKKKKKGFTPALFVSAPYMSWGLSYQECFLLHLHITRRCSLSSLLLTRTHNRSCFLSPPAQIRPEPNHSGGTYWAKTELTAKLSACWINLTLKVTLQINIRHQKY